MRFPTPALVLLGLLAAATPSLAGSDFRLVRARHTPGAFDPAAGEQLRIHFAISDPARVRVKIYDGRDLLIRTIESGQQSEAGAQEVLWDGRDQAGRAVPPEAYHYVVEAEAADGSAALTYDRTDSTGNRTVEVENLFWDASTSKVRYRIAQPARVSIRMGLKEGGPLLRSLRAWVPRQAGEHEELWDGWDDSHVIDLSEHPMLQVAADALSLPSNAVLVGPPPAAVEFVELSWPREERPSEAAHTKRFRVSLSGRVDQRLPSRARISVPESFPRDATGLALVRGVVPVTLDVAEEDRQRIVSERFETSFFLDGQFRVENEVGFLPTTWLWDTSHTSPGVHYLTGNVLGYQGQIGSATIKVMVEADQSPVGSSDDKK